MILAVAGMAVQKLAMTLSKEQEILMNVADIAIWTYLAESTLLRVEKQLLTKNESELAVEIAIVKTYFYDTADRINKAAKDATHSFLEGDEARMLLMGIKRFTKGTDINPKALRQIIAVAAIDKNAYNL